MFIVILGHSDFPDFRQPGILKWLVVEDMDHIGLGGSYLVYTRIRNVCLLRIQNQSEVIRYISEISDFQQPCILKTVGRKAKRTKIWALAVRA